MKTILYFLLGSLALACSRNKPAENAAAPSFYGSVITADSAITIEELKRQMGDKTELSAKVTAPVEAVCKKKGCWMRLKASDGSTMRVEFRDYGFFVPVDTKDKTAIVAGIARVHETPVADLKEVAKDDGASREEIEAIKEPARELVFEADGVILQ